jgi:hypothetical protein
MSKIFENKQVIHIVSEVIVLTGIIYYFSYKNKKLMTCIQELTDRVNTQEDMMKKQNQMIKELSDKVNYINVNSNTYKQPSVNFNTEKQPKTSRIEEISDNKDDISPNIHLSFIKEDDEEDNNNNEDEEQDNNEENLDDELKDELNELVD